MVTTDRKLMTVRQKVGAVRTALSKYHAASKRLTMHTSTAVDRKTVTSLARAVVDAAKQLTSD